MTAEHRFFAAHSAALRCIQETLQNAKEIRIATAYFEASGYQALQDTLRGKKIRLLVGRPQGGEDRVREMLDEFIRELSHGSQEGRTRAMRQLLESLEQGWMTVAVGQSVMEQSCWLDSRYLYHHAKLYIADVTSAVVTSANFSHHGLCTSREAGYVVTNLEDVAFFVERFDEYFEQAIRITQELIEALTQWLADYAPYIIYARALLELYGLPDENVPPKLPPLADYQKGVVSSVLRSLLEHDGAFLVASTGLGKTIIAAHVAAYLRIRSEVQTAIVICPAGMRETWRRWMRAAHLSSEEFSYHTLGRKDGDGNLPVLEHELRGVTEETLIILDESHHLRNEDGTDGDLRISNQRIQTAIRENKGRVLLLTATPYGKSLDEVQSQLNLLPSPKKKVNTPIGLEVESTTWSVNKLKELAELPTCTVVNTPDVVHHFGEQDENGERFVRFGEDKRYFPRRIRLETVRYENPFDDFFAELLESKLLYKATDSGKQGKRKRQMTQKDRLFDLPNSEGERLPLQEALFLHQFCSSPDEVWDVSQKMKQGTYSYQFARQTELALLIEKHERVLRSRRNPKNDPKIQKLEAIIRAAGKEKIVVFCEYHNTARYVTEGLKKLSPGIKIETAVEQSAEDLDSILRRFAPIANEVLPEDRDPNDEIQVLIASRAISEGYNLQDASILVNYDLPWTVLQLAQRMGRILRPWKQPRDITIYNFVPSTMGNERIRHARNWQERLKKRSHEHRSLAQIPVMVYDESKREGLAREYEMEKLGRELYLAKETRADLNLDEVMQFVNQVDELSTSTFYKDLAEIRNPDEIRRLPAGIRSAIQKAGPKRLFLLLKQGRNLYTVIADWQGNPLPESYRRDEVMRLIRCLPETQKAPFGDYPDDEKFDLWIERTRLKWADKLGMPPQRFQVICALGLV
ncbi:MAG: helicase-related protein [Anaerolineales bacterium]|nr:helicase-related protein [Anaerolineales bacterium]